MRTSEVLNTAADVIEQRGWSKGAGWYPSPGDTSPVCLEGALRAATGSVLLHNGYCPAYDAVREYLTTSRPETVNPDLGYVIPWSWNDRPDRTVDEVLEVLRAAAVIEQAKEQQDAPVEPQPVSA